MVGLVVCGLVWLAGLRLVFGYLRFWRALVGAWVAFLWFVYCVSLASVLGVVWFLVCGLLVIVSGVFFVWSLVVDYFGLRFGSGFDCGFLVLVRCSILCGNDVFRGV